MEMLMPLIALVLLLVAAEFAYRKYKVQPKSEDPNNDKSEHEEAVDAAKKNPGDSSASQR